ncbi:MAG: hypothetical protein K0U98_18430 [Deltaproteobacteria bacterium]|nr:hypothetical protein [Deltaproteobacteria bacterium]
MNSSPAVAITGVGSVTSLGIGRKELTSALQEGKPHLSPVDRSQGYHRPRGARLAALVQGADLTSWVKPRAARRMSPPSKLAVAAATMAVEESGLDVAACTGPVAVFVATSFGPTSFTERILNQVLVEGPEAASPMLFTESVANAPAAQIALTFHAVGANVTVTQREAGPLIALARGVEEVAAGRAEVAIVAAVDEISPVLHAAIDRFGALSGSRPQGTSCDGSERSEVARPFDLHRDGFLLAEGTGALVVEREEAARDRGAQVRAVVRDTARAFDPKAPRSSWSRDPHALAEALTNFLERSRVEIAQVDRIVSGASGSRGGDLLEALVLQQAFGGSLPPIWAPKGASGEYGGSLLVPAVLAAEGEVFGPTGGFRQPDPELAVIPHDGSPLDPPAMTLVTSLAAGGAASWMLLEPGRP